MISAKAKEAMEQGNLEKAQDLYCDYFMALDKYLVTRKMNVVRS